MNDRTDTDEILSAIAALADRAAAHDSRFDKIDGKLDKIDQRVSAIARNTLSPAECIALGISDARKTSGISGIPDPLPKAAKGR